MTLKSNRRVDKI